jgi:hypothetical protein
LFHTLWSKAVECPHYDKREWSQMQQMLWALQGLTPAPPGTEIEPPPWDVLLRQWDEEWRSNGGPPYDPLDAEEEP